MTRWLRLWHRLIGCDYEITGAYVRADWNIQLVAEGACRWCLRAPNQTKETRRIG